MTATETAPVAEGLRAVEDEESPWFGFVVRGLTHCHVTWDKDRGHA